MKWTVAKIATSILHNSCWFWTKACWRNLIWSGVRNVSPDLFFFFLQRHVTYSLLLLGTMTFHFYTETGFRSISRPPPGWNVFRQVYKSKIKADIKHCHITDTSPLWIILCHCWTTCFILSPHALGFIRQIKERTYNSDGGNVFITITSAFTCLELGWSVFCFGKWCASFSLQWSLSPTDLQEIWGYLIWRRSLLKLGERKRLCLCGAKH